MSRKIKIGLIILGLIVVGGILLLSLLQHFIISEQSQSGAGGLSYDKSIGPENSDMGLNESSFSVGMSEAKMSASPISAESNNYQSTDSLGEQSEVIDRMIIKNAQISMVVKDVREVIKFIEKMAVDKGGFVVTSNVEKSIYTGAANGNITIRVPAKEFTSGIGQIKENSIRIESERVDGQDVTEEYVDLDARLKNLRATEEQFLNIMKQAVKIGDILAVQRELTSVRGNIESLMGRMKYLKQSAEMSTITVSLATDASELPVVDENDEWNPIATLKNASRSLVGFSKGLVNFIIWIVVYIPLWLSIVLIIWLIKRILRRRKFLKQQ